MSSDNVTKNLPTEDKIDSLIEMVRQLSSNVTGLWSEVTEIKNRLTTLEQTVEKRLYDTRPIWEAVLSQLSQIQARQDSQQEQLDEISETMKSVKGDIHAINRRINLVHKEMLGIKEEQEVLHERIDRLEKEPA